MVSLLTSSVSDISSCNGALFFYHFEQKMGLKSFASKTAQLTFFDATIEFRSKSVLNADLNTRTSGLLLKPFCRVYMQKEALSGPETSCMLRNTCTLSQTDPESTFLRS